MSVESSTKLEFMHVELRGQIEDKSELVTDVSSRYGLCEALF